MPRKAARTARLLLGAALLLALTQWRVTEARAADAPAPLRIGVLTDMSSSFADFSGPGSVEAVRMAVEDYGGKVLGRPIEVLVGDHQNKADIGSSIASQWYDQQQVQAIFDVPNSGVALAVQDVTRRHNKVLMISSAGTSDLTGKACSPNGIAWVYDTYALAAGTGSYLARHGGNTWYFVTLDYAFGWSLERDVTQVITPLGAKVLGDSRHPLNTPDLSSFLLKAQASGAQVIALANAGTDLVNSVKQAAEFHVTTGGKTLAGLIVYISDVNSIGLQLAQGLILTSPFYWDSDEPTRAFARRFFARTGKMPTMAHAGNYTAVLHYLKAVAAAGTDEAGPVLQKIKSMPIDDFMIHDGHIREDGRVMRDMFVFRVKTPSESRAPWDYYDQIERVPAEQAARPLEQSECPLLAHK